MGPAEERVSKPRAPSGKRRKRRHTKVVGKDGALGDGFQSLKVAGTGNVVALDEPEEECCERAATPPDSDSEVREP